MVDTTQKSKNNKLAIFIIIDVMIITALIFYFAFFRPYNKMHNAPEIKITGIYLPQPQKMLSFNLTDNHGKLFTRDDLRGHWTMMFFGFTNCGMVCPTTLSALNKMYKMMEKDLPANEIPQVVFISVDPDRDTVEKINDYVTAFNPHFIGARAGIPETIALEKQLHIAAAKMQVDGQGVDHYTINHSSEVLLINPDANLQAYFSYPHEPEQMVKEYKLILTTLKG